MDFDLPTRSQTKTISSNSTPDLMPAHDLRPTVSKQDFTRHPRRINRVRRRVCEALDVSAIGIGNRLVELRLELQLTQAEVALAVPFESKSGKRSNIVRPLSRSTYCMYELGRVEPSLQTIVSLAHVLQASPEWLAFGTGTKPRPKRQPSASTPDSGW